MERLIESSIRKVELTQLNFIRSLMDDIHWEHRLIGIRGARGVGKTTLLLQYIKQYYATDPSALYLSLDNIWFAEHSLLSLIDNFVKRGGKHLLLDEVHKYPNWSQELKNAYDDYPDLKIVFTGSSLLEILNARADLSRRAVVYQMQGLSFREYLQMLLAVQLPVLKMNDILSHHREISSDLLAKLKPFQYFDSYLEQGYYPFSFEMKELYGGQLEEVISLILEIELPLLRGVDIAYVHKLKQLLLIIAQSVPFTPNIQKLSEHIGINRNTLVTYLHYLQEAALTKHLYRDSKGLSRLQKPDKIYLENTNLTYLLGKESTDSGKVRECFFLNQVAYKHHVEYPEKADFLVDRKYTFEVGGKGKNKRQVYGIDNAFIAADNIEYGFEDKIPLWMFGFLY